MPSADRLENSTPPCYLVGMENLDYSDGLPYDLERLRRSWVTVRRAGMPAPAERLVMTLLPFGPSGPVLVIPPIEPPPVAPPLPPILPPQSPGLFLYP